MGKEKKSSSNELHAECQERIKNIKELKEDNHDEC
jgi:hypothetical protein